MPCKKLTAATQTNVNFVKHFKNGHLRYKKLKSARKNFQTHLLKMESSNSLAKKNQIVITTYANWLLWTVNHRVVLMLTSCSSRRCVAASCFSWVDEKRTKNCAKICFPQCRAKEWPQASVCRLRELIKELPYFVFWAGCHLALLPFPLFFQQLTPFQWLKQVVKQVISFKGGINIDAKAHLNCS